MDQKSQEHIYEMSRPPERAVESFPRSDSMSTIFPVIFTETSDKENPVFRVGKNHPSRASLDG